VGVNALKINCIGQSAAKRRTGEGSKTIETVYKAQEVE
jgi:hypothetical protein